MQTMSVLGRHDETLRLKPRIINEMNPSETDADVERTCPAPLPDEQIDDPMYTALRNDKRANYCSDANVVIAISKSKTRGFAL